MSKPGAREAILASALKLFGERGFDGVRNSEILDDAGQRNQTALQYHFGSREGLYDAIMIERLKVIDARRLEMMPAEARGDAALGFGACVRVLVEPLIDEVETGPGGRDYIRFLRQFISRPGFDFVRMGGVLPYPGMKRMIAALDRHLAGMAPERRAFAISLMLQIAVTMLCSWHLERPDAFDRARFMAAVTGACRSIQRSLSPSRQTRPVNPARPDPAAPPRAAR